MRFPDFKQAIDVLGDRLRTAPLVHTGTWQSTDTSKKPEAATYELTNIFFTVPLYEFDKMRVDIQPNVPWADEHFDERLCGIPHNPPPSWVRWPWANSAEKFREGAKFSHTYPERIWPKKANNNPKNDRRGIRYLYGDFDDVIRLLDRHPYTRQAYIPIWFPEDTGVAHGERVPCTLGYHVMMRDNRFNMFYPIRSCDFRRHLRDDIYMAVRLLLTMLSTLRSGNGPNVWRSVSPGEFSMWIGSCHIFVNDHKELFG